MIGPALASVRDTDLCVVLTDGASRALKSEKNRLALRTLSRESDDAVNRWQERQF